jgi:hypothetical protein
LSTARAWKRGAVSATRWSRRNPIGFCPTSPNSGVSNAATRRPTPSRSDGGNRSGDSTVIGWGRASRRRGCRYADSDRDPALTPAFYQRLVVKAQSWSCANGMVDAPKLSLVLHRCRTGLRGSCRHAESLGSVLLGSTRTHLATIGRYLDSWGRSATAIFVVLLH